MLDIIDSSDEEYEDSEEGEEYVEDDKLFSEKLSYIEKILCLD